MNNKQYRKYSRYKKYINPQSNSNGVIFNNIKVLDVALKFQKELIQRATKYEKDFSLFLVKNKIKFEFQKIVPITMDSKIVKFFICDFYIPKKKLIIEIDGDYHLNREQVEKDRIKDYYLQGLKYKVIRIKNSEIENSINFLKYIL